MCKLMHRDDRAAKPFLISLLNKTSRSSAGQSTRFRTERPEVRVLARRPKRKRPLEWPATGPENRADLWVEGSTPSPSPGKSTPPSVPSRFPPPSKPSSLSTSCQQVVPRSFFSGSDHAVGRHLTRSTDAVLPLVFCRQSRSNDIRTAARGAHLVFIRRKS